MAIPTAMGGLATDTAAVVTARTDTTVATDTSMAITAGTETGASPTWRGMLLESKQLNPTLHLH